MSFLFPLIYISYFLVCGHMISARVIPNRNIFIHIWAGLIIGLTGMMWCVVPGAFVFDFTLKSHFCAIVLMGLITIAVKKFVISDTKIIKADKIPVAIFITFIAIASIIISLKYFHVIRPDELGLRAGPSTYGDLPLHLGIITSLVEQRQFPPDYSIFPGIRLSYPFLINLLSASLYMLGMTLRWSVLLPDILLSICVTFGFIMFSYTITKNALMTSMSAFMFFLSGGFGFIYFVDFTKKNPDNFMQLFGGAYHGPSNFADGNIDLWNVICHILVPQRTSLVGWAILFFVLWMLYQNLFLNKQNNKYIIMSGLLIGFLPMIHTASFFLLTFISIVWLCFYITQQKNKLYVFKKWIPFVLIITVLSVPQLAFWTFSSETAERSVSFHFNWANYDDNWLWYWVKNGGVVFILALPAIVSLKRDRLGFYSAAILLFIIADVVAFTPVREDNNKIFHIWYAFTTIIIAEYLIIIFDKLKGIKGRRILLAMALFLATFSGVLTVIHDYASNPYVFSKSDLEIAEFVKKNTPKRAVFTSSTIHNNPISALAGRTIVCGSESWLFSHGINYFKRVNDLREFYVNPDRITDLQEEYNIDYILVGHNERKIYKIDNSKFDEKFPRIYFENGFAIYAVSEKAQKFNNYNKSI